MHLLAKTGQYESHSTAAISRSARGLVLIPIVFAPLFFAAQAIAPFRSIEIHPHRTVKHSDFTLDLMLVRNLPQKIVPKSTKDNKVGPRIHPATSARVAIRG
jgi:hypothetical protein